MKRKDEYMERTEKMEKRMLKFYAVGFGVGVVTLAYLGILGANAILKTKEGQMQPIETSIEQTEEIKEGDSKVFQEGEHWYTVRIKSKDCDPCVLNDCETPEGYRAEGVVPYCIKEGDKVIDEGFRIDYSNTEPVVVYAHYNEETGKYDYENPGFVIYEVKGRIVG